MTTVRTFVECSFPVFPMQKICEIVCRTEEKASSFGMSFPFQMFYGHRAQLWLNAIFGNKTNIDIKPYHKYN